MAIIDIQSMFVRRKTADSTPITQEIAKDFDWDVEMAIGGPYTIEDGDSITFDTIPNPKYFFLKTEADAAGTRPLVKVDLGLGDMETAYMIMEFEDASALAPVVSNDSGETVNLTVYIGGDN